MHQHISYNSTRGQKEPQHSAHLFHTIHSLVFIRYPLLSWLCVFFETKRSKLIMWLIGDSLWKKDKGNHFSPWLYIDTSLVGLKLLINSRKVSFFSTNITSNYSRSGNTSCVCVCVFPKSVMFLVSCPKHDVGWILKTVWIHPSLYQLI